MRGAWRLGLIAASLLALPDAVAGELHDDARFAPLPELRRVFRSGFEAPVALRSMSSGQQARLVGMEPGGSSWDGLDHVFELVAPGALGRHVTIEMRAARSFAGARSLHMRQNLQQDGAQARLQVFGDDEVFGNEILTRRAYFVPSANLASLARQEESVSIGGTRESRGSSLPAGHPGADFSMPLYLVRRGSQLVFAQAIVDYAAGRNWSDWTRPPKGLLAYARGTPCPLDRWFQLDVYVLRHVRHGKIKVWLDGKLIIDLANVRTKNDTGRWFTKLADVDSEPAPFELWVDEVEIWSRPASGKQALTGKGK